MKKYRDPIIILEKKEKKKEKSCPFKDFPRKSFFFFFSFLFYLLYFNLLVFDIYISLPSKNPMKT